MYVLDNTKGEIKKFKDYNEMKKWWFTLTHNESLTFIDVGLIRIRKKINYILFNHEKKYIKDFTDYNELIEWWLSLSKEESFEFVPLIVESKKGRL